MTIRTGLYSALMLLTFVVASTWVVLHKRSDLIPWIGHCNPQGYADGDYFLAYCHSGKYGDFEHYAYWNELGEISMDPVKAADVLFLGNSRTQYTFSTEAVSQWFDRHQIDHYLFGFGVGSLYVVPQQFFRKFDLQPRVLVINADPFFHDFWSRTNREMLNEDLKTRWRFALKEKLQTLQASYCEEDQGDWLHRKLCRGSGETLYRETGNGHWLVDYYREDKGIPVRYTDAFKGHVDKAAELAQGFMAESGVAPECMIITATPHSNTPILYAQNLAKAMGAPWVFPVVKNLKTIDESHLNPESAERWSAAFMEQAADIITRCTAG